MEQENLEKGDDPDDYLMVMDISIPKFDVSAKYSDEEMCQRSAPVISWKAKHSGEVTKARMQGKHIASFQNTGDLKIYDLSKKSEIWTFKGHETEGFGLDMGKDGVVVTGSSDKTVKVWKLD